MTQTDGESFTPSQINLTILFVGLIIFFSVFWTFLDPSLFLGGLLSGGLHALTGPDHLAALLPSITKHNSLRASFIGLLWGLGHGFSSSLLGIIAFYLRDTIFEATIVSFLNHYSNLAIGLTLIIVGIMGLYETSEQTDSSIEITESFPDQSIRSSKSSSTSWNSYLAIFLNGFFLGLSWDVLPSLTPALSLVSPTSLSLFLLAYSLGTVLSMSLLCGVLSLSLSLSLSSQIPPLPSSSFPSVLLSDLESTPLSNILPSTPTPPCLPPSYLSRSCSFLSLQLGLLFLLYDLYMHTLHPSFLLHSDLSLPHPLSLQSPSPLGLIASSTPSLLSTPFRHLSHFSYSFFHSVLKPRLPLLILGVVIILTASTLSPLKQQLRRNWKERELEELQHPPPLPPLPSLPSSSLLKNPLSKYLPFLSSSFFLSKDPLPPLPPSRLHVI